MLKLSALSDQLFFESADRWLFFEILRARLRRGSPRALKTDKRPNLDWLAGKSNLGLALSGL